MPMALHTGGLRKHSTIPNPAPPAYIRAKSPPWTHACTPRGSAMQSAASARGTTVITDGWDAITRPPPRATQRRPFSHPVVGVSLPERRLRRMGPSRRDTAAAEMPFSVYSSGRHGDGLAVGRGSRALRDRDMSAGGEDEGWPSSRAPGITERTRQPGTLRSRYRDVSVQRSRIGVLGMRTSKPGPAARVL